MNNIHRFWQWAKRQGGSQSKFWQRSISTETYRGNCSNVHSILCKPGLEVISNVIISNAKSLEIPENHQGGVISAHMRGGGCVDPENLMSEPYAWGIFLDTKFTLTFFVDNILIRRLRTWNIQISLFCHSSSRSLKQILYFPVQFNY